MPKDGHAAKRFRDRFRFGKSRKKDDADEVSTLQETETFTSQATGIGPNDGPRSPPAEEGPLSNSSQLEQVKDAAGDDGHEDNTKVVVDDTNNEAGQEQDIAETANDKDHPANESKSSSLWDVAYEQLRTSDPDLVLRFQRCLAAMTNQAEDVAMGPEFADRTVEEALSRLREAQVERNLHRTSAKVRKYFEGSVKLVIASKDLISGAVAANPYAAMAWSGISIMLPLLLNPTTENEAALKGLDHAANLITVYRWREMSYKGLEDFEDLAVQLYSSILEYEANLLVYIKQPAAKRWAGAVLQAGEWSRRLHIIEERDARCRDLVETIADQRVHQWRLEEAALQKTLYTKLSKFEDEQTKNVKMLYSNYEQSKNINPDRVKGTCEWFLNHSNFLTWRETQQSALLWVSADPGCGKSVLAKHLLERRGAILTANEEPPMLAYFFFKDGDKERSSGARAICALIHQLILQNAELYQYAEYDFRHKDKGFLDDFDAVWRILMDTVRADENREIICVIDALDECRESDRRLLIGQLEKLYASKAAARHHGTILKFLVTSRAESDIIRGFKYLTETMAEVRLKGEDESEQISREIDLVVQHRISRIAYEQDLDVAVTNVLEDRLGNVPHRTYLWLYLTFNAIERDIIDRSSIDRIVSSISKDVNEAYTKILDKSRDKNKAKKMLQIVLAAARPLTVREMSVAIHVDQDCMITGEVETWSPKGAEQNIKNTCGLFLTVIDARIHLIHQTARDFLIKDDLSAGSHSVSGSWSQIFTIAECHLVLAQICAWYILCLKIRYPHSIMSQYTTDFTGNGPKFPYPVEELSESSDELALLAYSVHLATYSFREADTLKDRGLSNIVASRLLASDCLLSRLWSAFAVDEDNLDEGYPDPNFFQHYFHGILLAAFYGLGSVVDVMLERNPAEKYSLNGWGQNALSLAAKNGHPDVVRRLISDHGFDINHADSYQMTPLALAVIRGHFDVVKTLLSFEDVDIEARNQVARTPLCLAVQKGEPDIVKLLLEYRNVATDSLLKHEFEPDPDHLYQLVKSPAGRASAYLSNNDSESSSAMNSANGAFVNSQDASGKSPLMYSYSRLITDQLLKHHADVKLQDFQGRTALSHAASSLNDWAITHLWDAKSELDAVDHSGRSPIFHAVRVDNFYVVRLLCRYAALGIRDKYGRTPLAYAARNACPRSVKALLNDNAEADARDNRGRTALAHAAASVDTDLIPLGPDHCLSLVETHLGYEDQLQSKLRQGRGPFSRAVSWETDTLAAMDILLRCWADINSRDEAGRTPLSHAANHAADWGVDQKLEQLLERGAVVDVEDEGGRTPLSRAAAAKLAIFRRRASVSSWNTESRSSRSSTAGPDTEETTPKATARTGSDAGTLESKLVSSLDKPKSDLPRIERPEDGAVGGNGRTIAEGEETKALSEYEDEHQRTKLSSWEDFETIGTITSIESQHLEADEEAVMRVVSALLQYGANPNAKDKEGLTPVDHARKAGNRFVVKLFEIVGRGAEIGRSAPEILAAQTRRNTRSNRAQIGIGYRDIKKNRGLKIRPSEETRGRRKVLMLRTLGRQREFWKLRGYRQSLSSSDSFETASTSSTNVDGTKRSDKADEGSGDRMLITRRRTRNSASPVSDSAEVTSDDDVTTQPSSSMSSNALSLLRRRRERRRFRRLLLQNTAKSVSVLKWVMEGNYVLYYDDISGPRNGHASRA